MYKKKKSILYISTIQKPNYEYYDPKNCVFAYCLLWMSFLLFYFTIFQNSMCIIRSMHFKIQQLFPLSVEPAHRCKVGEKGLS